MEAGETQTAAPGGGQGEARGELVPPDSRWWELLPFTTHRIEVADGLWTTDHGVVADIDVRVKAVVDACGGSLAGRTVVDLGCLEGGFTLAFARLGADESVGIEARAVSHRRCELARQLIGLRNARFVHGDIKEELARCGRRFDVVFAAGILYHVADPWVLLRSIAGSCRRVALIDTHVADPRTPSHSCSQELVDVSTDCGTWRGRRFAEYSAACDERAREELLWAAWSNTESFWPLEEDLVAMMRAAGFARVTRLAPDPQLSGAWQVDQINRVLYLGWKD
jgi:SAM-dependent methyltransferase